MLFFCFRLFHGTQLSCIIRSVSYTHLAFSNLIGVFGVKPPTKDLDVTAALALMSIILIAVSYTHLDVYKRQHRCRSGT